MSKGKVVAGVVALAAVIGGIVAITKKSSASSESESLSGLTIFDQYGNIISTSNRIVKRYLGAYPGICTEGEIITASVIAKNTSYKKVGGSNTPVAATLTMKLSGTGAFAFLTESTNPKNISFGAGESKTLTSADWSALEILIPLGNTGSGTIKVSMLDPSGNLLGSVSASLTVNAADIQYGGSISFV